MNSPLIAHTSVMFMPPEGNFAHVRVQGNENAPHFQHGDVLLVDTSVTRFVADGPYVIEINGRQTIRYLRDGECGLRVFTGSMPSLSFAMPAGARVLGMVEAVGRVRRVGHV